MNFQDMSTTKKGNFSEKILDEYLISIGIIPYAPVISKAHPFDRLCATSDKKKIFVAECKGKARRTYYPDTGINEKHYLDYIGVREAHNIDVWLFFVDEYVKKIYGNLLSELDKPREIEHKGKTLKYPLVQPDYKGTVIRYFPLVAMVDIFDLNDDQSGELKQLSTRNYEYEEVIF